MKKSIYKQISGISLLILGGIHLAVHVLFQLNPEKPPIVAEMNAFEINLMGTHTLLKFHEGFSLMTGFFILFLGVIVLMVNRKLQDISLDRWLLVIIGSLVVISIVYFHVLAYGVTAFAFVVYVWGIVKNRQTV